MKYLVGEYDVGWDGLLVGELFPQQSQFFEQVRVFVLKFHGGEYRHFGLISTGNASPACLSVGYAEVFLFFPLDDYHPGRLFSIEYVFSGFRNFQMVVFVIGYFKISQIQHLQQVVVPVLGGNVPSHSVGFQFIVSSFEDLLGSTPPENVDEQTGSDTLVGPYDGAQGLLYDDGSVEALGRISAYVTVAAVVIHGFSEIIQQDSSAANVCFGILLHPFQFLKVDFLLVAFGGKLGQKHDISQ